MTQYGGSSDYTVTHVLRAMDDIVTSIEDINTNGVLSGQVAIPNTQAAANTAMDENVGTLEVMLTWSNNGVTYDTGINTQPDVAGYSGDKSSYTDAITLGKAYIAANS
tara:strand:+ start:358 stop:681 length:324 start_codon:yes stop_codon:yes gene_type:complete